MERKVDLALMLRASLMLVLVTACAQATQGLPVPTSAHVSPTAASPSPTVATSVRPSGAPAASPGAREQARVVSVTDGDTIRVEISGRIYPVRYIGMDTPETVHPSRPVEEFGKQATEANRRLVEGRTVLLEKDISETDQYGRLLRYVYVEQFTGLVMVNAELLRLGYARVTTYPPDVKYVDLFLELERDARARNAGLWGLGSGPTATPVATATPAGP